MTFLLNEGTEFVTIESSNDILTDLEIEPVNICGVKTRGVDDGGDQERTVATDYFEQTSRSADRGTRTAAVLRKIDESYEREARQIDGLTEHRRTGFDG